MSAVPEETLDGLREYVEREVRAGFAAYAEIPDAACDAFGEEGLDQDELRQHAVRFTAVALAVVQQEAEGWPPLTDCDRLDLAFAALERQGLIARHDFSCCQTCGHSEAWDEVQTALGSGRSVHGYAFYHQQDTEAAVDGHGLLLAYGATRKGSEPLGAVGREIVEALEEQGLTVHWSGSTEQRILVELDWKRRRS